MGTAATSESATMYLSFLCLSHALTSGISVVPGLPKTWLTAFFSSICSRNSETFICNRYKGFKPGKAGMAVRLSISGGGNTEFTPQPSAPDPEENPAAQQPPSSDDEAADNPAV